MVKVSFNKALAFKDPKKESLILDVQDSEAAVLVRPQSKVWCWCFCLGLALVLSGVVVGGAFLYRYYMLEVQGIMDGRADERKDAHTSLQMVSIKEDQVFVCGLKYFEEDYEFDEEVEVEFEAPLMLLEENVSFFEDDEVELIKVPVPEFRDGDSAGILHDFTMKLTAYLDLNLDRCYIITLNTSIVMPPRDFHEFLVNIKAGMYLPQTYLMREEMMVTERLDSTSDLGYYINDLCKDKDTYRLQRRDIILGMQKREALNCHKIRHFENKFVVETLICEP
ncbi:integral membrane protein 2B-like isoform X1 [Sinocyclocheilus anshuiensis]|uniref:integral membrane protein 2B-like isoform X1 n=1 Tax=Sinocyclocheilus anshuiensis TaxID=1608454 RepID=UPI0007B9D037|nr:PREDICTED: integral membrane protein 2B-like isoform X1 [Sinocyclocheilus anshuiensis]